MRRPIAWRRAGTGTARQAVSAGASAMQRRESRRTRDAGPRAAERAIEAAYQQGFAEGEAAGDAASSAAELRRRCSQRSARSIEELAGTAQAPARAKPRRTW